jgi:hypothetical protein
MPKSSSHDSVYRSRLLTELTRPTTLLPSRITLEAVGSQGLVVAIVLEGLEHAFSGILRLPSTCTLFRVCLAPDYHIWIINYYIDEKLSFISLIS